MESKRNNIKFTIFIIIIILLGVGGFLFTKYLTDDSISTPMELFTSPKVTDYRINKAKDYVYFDNVVTIIDNLEIEYKDIIINLKVAEDITKKLNSETNELKNTMTFIKDTKIDPNVTYEENDQGIYSLTYRVYEVYNFDNYISILIKDIDYDVINLNVIKSIKTYIFDKNENLIVTENDLLKKYNVELNTIKEQIKGTITAHQEEVDGQNLINIDETMNDLKYVAFINKIGDLEIGFIVNSTKQNYYDSIIIK